jgi:hypothetical protein
MNLANQGGEKLFRGCHSAVTSTVGNLESNLTQEAIAKDSIIQSFYGRNSETKLSDLMCGTSFKEHLDAVAAGLLACSNCLSLSV